HETIVPGNDHAHDGGMSGHALDCLKCPSLCCRMAGYVEVSRSDIRRLAQFLGLTVRAFEDRHIVERSKSGGKRIKSGYKVCQFLGEDRMCTVYAGRPKDCRGYVCWDQRDDTVYQFARFFQTAPAELRAQEKEEEAGG
ncbi:MAG: YkgJ family cysteine cluster protein, partial [Pseudomonadota bacterium]|nr:YkgJ family cysteine cluster protein [Pseudomonadota bacterium]